MRPALKSESALWRFAKMTDTAPQVVAAATAEPDPPAVAVCSGDDDEVQPAMLTLRTTAADTTAMHRTDECFMRFPLV